MPTTRTFVAIASDPPLQRRAEAVIRRLSAHAPDARWVDPENLHLTLAFLGDLADREVAEVCRRVDWVARANRLFSLAVRGVGAFPDPLRPRAIWLGCGEGAEGVMRLQADLIDALDELLPRGENRAYLPHWTLARLGQGPGRRGGRSRGGVSPRLPEALAALADYPAGEVSVEEVTVFGSELRPGGPEYYALATCPLGVGREG